jgi:hypothetical protein
MAGRERRTGEDADGAIRRIKPTSAAAYANGSATSTVRCRTVAKSRPYGPHAATTSATVEGRYLHGWSRAQTSGASWRWNKRFASQGLTDATAKSPMATKIDVDLQVTAADLIDRFGPVSASAIQAT